MTVLKSFIINFKLKTCSFSNMFLQHISVFLPFQESKTSKRTLNTQIA